MKIRSKPNRAKLATRSADGKSASTPRTSSRLASLVFRARRASKIIGLDSLGMALHLRPRLKVKGPAMKIGELSKQTGVSPSRIRFYEAEGVIPRADRAANG